LQDVQPEKTYIVAPVQQGWPFAEGVEVISVGDIARVFAGQHSPGDADQRFGD
jgi:hypothetical protein